MCIAIYRNKDSVLTKKLLKSCHRNNPDSWGFSTPDDKNQSMIVQRGLSGFREFWKEFREVQKDKPMLIHFRIATSGEIDKHNCHPFLIDNKHALIHNGNIERKLDILPDKISDTNLFIEKILRPIFTHPKFKKDRFW